MTNDSARWRTLAEPTYGIEEFGAAARFPAGTEILLRTGAHDVDPKTGCGIALTHDPDTVVVLADPDGKGFNRQFHVTASALRFVGDA